MKIKVRVGYNERTKQYYSQDFEVVNFLPEVGESYSRYGNLIVDSIEEVSLDCENRGIEVYNYDYYKIICRNEEGDLFDDYYEAIERESEEVWIAND